MATGLTMLAISLMLLLVALSWVLRPVNSPKRVDTP